MKLFITGGSGYVGAMLADQFAKRDDVEAIIILDKEEETALTKNNVNKNKVFIVLAPSFLIQNTLFVNEHSLFVILKFHLQDTLFYISMNYKPVKSYLRRGHL